MGTDLSLYEEFANEIVSKIENKQLNCGDKLPSIRQYAQQKEVSVNTIVNCYRFLEQHQYVSVQDKSGYIVLPRDHVMEMPLPKFASKSVRLARDKKVNRQVIRHPFERAQVGPELLPIAALSKCLANSIRKHAKQAQIYGNIQGEDNLRSSISQHFKEQGFIFGRDELVINNGCLDSVKIALEIVSKPGDCIAVTSPCFSGLIAMLAMMDRSIVEIPSDDHGVDIVQLESRITNHEIVACLFTANHQNPNGLSLPNRQKEYLAKLSNKSNIPIIEDDVYQELYFGQTLPLPIKAFDEEGTVIWCSSISKTLASGYRIGWSLPGKYIDEFIQHRAVQSLGVNLPLQLAIAEFFDKKLYSRHLKRLRKQLAVQMIQYQQLLRNELSSMTNFYVSQPHGGLAIWVYVKGLDAKSLVSQVERLGIDIRAGNNFSTRGLYNAYFRVNVGYPLTGELKKQLSQVCQFVKQQLEA